MAMTDCAGASVDAAVVVLGLGSNRGYRNQSPRQLLEAACGLLGRRVAGLRVSSLYRTAPMYHREQEDFYNMVAAGRFAGSPRDLLGFVHEVEARLGRDRGREFPNGPRSMDIDIELFGRERVAEPDLVIPHPRLRERAFVLVPMLEVFSRNADLCIDKSLYSECLGALPPQGIARLPERSLLFRRNE